MKKPRLPLSSIRIQSAIVLLYSLYTFSHQIYTNKLYKQILKNHLEYASHSFFGSGRGSVAFSFSSRTYFPTQRF